MNLAERLRDRALALGVDLFGVAPAAPPACAPALLDALAGGLHAGMDWLARGADRRADPLRVLPGARAIVTIGLSCFAEDPPAAVWNDPRRGRFARYAWGPDYHNVLKPVLDELAAILREGAGPSAQVRVYVDTGPVLERHAAARAGLGFIGRNTMLIAPALGSHVLLGVLLTDVELDIDAHSAGGCLDDDARHPCGRCARCMASCPTGALTKPFVLDARRCLSYLTIEHRGAIPAEHRSRLGNRVFGCDDCQSVCPWTRRFSRPAARPFLRFDAERWAPNLADLLALDEAGFMERYAGTPVQRTGWIRLQRNALVALGNGGRPEAGELLAPFLRGADPLLAEHARWALQQCERSRDAAD